MRNLFDGLPSGAHALEGWPDERFDDLLRRPGVRIERIVSTGQATAAGQWLAQTWDEWVLLLAGSAGLTLDGDAPLALRPGDSLLISAGRRHRVDWTGADPPTVWLAVHMDQGETT